MHYMVTDTVIQAMIVTEIFKYFDSLWLTLNNYEIKK